jgi:hypothetical protein
MIYEENTQAPADEEVVETEETIEAEVVADEVDAELGGVVFDQLEETEDTTDDEVVEEDEEEVAE